MVTPSTGNEAETAPKSSAPGAQSVAKAFPPLTDEELVRLDRWIYTDWDYEESEEAQQIFRLIAELRALREAVKPIVAGVHQYDVLSDPLLRPLWLEGFVTPAQPGPDSPPGIALTDLRRLRDLLPAPTPAPDGGTT